MTTVTRTANAVERAYSFIEIKSIDEEKRIIRGIATTPSVDRVGDVVEPMGGEFNLPLPLLLHHDHSAPVGEVYWAKPTKKGIEFEARIAKMDEPGRVKDRLDEAWHSLKAKLIRAVSIGFKNIEHTVMETGGWKFIRWAWLELSLVVVPANADATITSIKSIDRELRAASGKSQPATRSTTARVGASHKKRSVTGETPMTTISEQISAWEAELDRAEAKRTAVQEKALKEGRAKDAEEREDFDDLTAKIKEIKQELADLREIEGSKVEKTAVAVSKDIKTADDAAKSRNGGGNYGRTTVTGPNKNIPQGVAFARYVMCYGHSKGDNYRAKELAEKHYPDDKRIANFAEMKAAVGGAWTADSAGWAEDIAEAQTIATDFIDFLRPMTIVDRIQGFTRVPFNVKVSRLATDVGGYWKGQSLPTPLTSGVFDTVTMDITGVGSIAVLTKEQMRFSNINAEATIRDALARKLVRVLDATFVSTSSAVSNVSPAGILQGLSAIAANGSGAAADIRADLQDLYAPFSAANISRRNTQLLTTENLHLALQLTYDNGLAAFPGITGDGGQALGFPVLASNSVSVGDVIMLSPQDIMLADDGQVNVEFSDQASLEMLDGSLEQVGNTGVGATTAGMVSLWQTGMVGIKVERMINWKKARSAAVAYIGAAGWNGVATA